MKKKHDPRMVALLDQAEKHREVFERWYGRLQRAARALDRESRALKRIAARIRRLEAEFAPIGAD